jgi:DNA-binding transcriptional LysR family regulator
MNLADLKTFIAVAETGSINRAAARLNLTQPAVTRRVQSFESEMGVPLLDRSSKPPTLTEDGRRALAHARRVVSALDDLSSQVGARGGLAGEFRLGVAPGFAEAALGGPLDAVIRAFPRLTVRIVSNWSARLLETLRGDVIDAAFVLLTEPQSAGKDLELRALRHDNVVVVAARRATMPASPELADLGRHPWVLNPVGCGFRAALQRALDRARGDLNVRAEVQGYDLQLSLVARGIGLGLMPAARLKASALKKDVKVIAVTDFRLTVTPALVSRVDHHRLSAVLDLLAANSARIGLAQMSE